VARVSDGLSLPAMLSRLLVAFTIELDNEFEHRMPHRTSIGGRRKGSGGPWLTSQVMWSNFLRYLPEAGRSVGELGPLIALSNLAGLERWGYVAVSPDAAPGAATPPRRDWIVRPTSAGRRAQEVWAPLPGLVEQRWTDRYGEAAITRLRDALTHVLVADGRELPDYLPIATHELATDAVAVQALAREQQRSPVGPAKDLSALLARVLVAFTLDVESPSPVSAPIGANCLRVLRAEPTALRDLPGLTGVSKEAIAMSLTVLKRHRLADVGPATTAARGQAAHLTPRGLATQAGWASTVRETHRSWEASARPAAELRTELTALLEHRSGDEPTLAVGLRPFLDGWRAQRPYLTQTSAVRADPIAALPAHPMVLHRGGWPDGS
jgi:hypothetical protein